MTLLNLMIEGFSSLRFGCTAALAMLGLAPVLVSRERAALSAIVFWMVSGISGWARFADLWLAPPDGVGLALLGFGVCAVVGWVAARPGVGSAVAAAAWSGVVAGWLWVPCVGRYLSDPLNDAATNRVGTFLPIMFYVVGVALPLFAIAAVPWLFARVESWRDSRLTSRAGLAFGVVLGLVVALGWYSDFVVRFTG